MRRVHVLEFEDLAWFPRWIRISITNLIVVFSRFVGVPATLGALVKRVVREQGVDQVVDLGSGSGGSMPEVMASVHAEAGMEHVTLLMSDLYPNLDALEAFHRDGNDRIRYHPEAVNAMDLERAPPGLRTMVNCFHHMRPDDAKAILRSAQRSGQPLLIYEMGENMVPFALWVLLLPISLPIVFVMALCLTPFVRPLSARQLLFTYLIPIIPAFYAWDGQASMPRIYTPDDIDELLEGLGTASYRWEKGPALQPNGKALGSYLLGIPERAPSSIAQSDHAPA